MSVTFVHVRCRSAYSLLEGAMHVEDIRDLCVADRMPAVALTDADNLFGALEFSEILAAAGVQPIIGATVSIAATPPGAGARVEPDGAIALLAQSEAGYLNLMRIVSAAYLDVGPLDPAHVRLDVIERCSEGLILLTGGPRGPIDRALSAGRDEAAEALLRRFDQAFPGRVYVEIQRPDGPSTHEAGMLDLAYRSGLPLVASVDPHFARPAQADAHDALLCIKDGAYLTQTDRRRLGPGHAFATAAEAGARFADLPEALGNTVEIAKRCAYRPVGRAPILPRFTSEAGRDEDAELAAQARAGLAERLTQVTPSAPEAEYWARLDLEIGVITKMGFAGYFLIVADFIKWAKARGIPVGPGRGSGAGSLVAWVLTITDLDPLRFGLLFERFLNPERVSMPDFDIDFCQDRRGEVIDYVKHKYGSDRVAQIITFGSLQARAVLRDVGRVMQLPFGLVDRLAKMIPNAPGQQVTLAQALKEEPRLAQARREEPAVGRLLDVAVELEGLYRNASTHAAGVVIGDRPLVELTPLYRDPRSELPATQFNMTWVEKAGLVKFDFLGLKTLTVIERIVDFVCAGGVDLDLDRVPLDDPRTYELLGTGAAVGVFQLESSGMRDTLKKLQPDKIEDLIALISLYRPGPMKNIDIYVDRKFGRADADYLHPTLEPILRETHGVIIYQEQVMQIAQVLSGYRLGEADLLRRAMGKKKKEEMDKQKSRFLDGAAANGVSADRAGHIFELVAEFAGYGFNKSHAAAYALIAFQTAYLKAHHPVEFLAGSMSLDIDNSDKLAVFFQEARRMGVRVLPPDINRSGADFKVEGPAVRFALGGVRNVAVGAMGHLVAERDRGGPFRDLADFARRLDPKAVNKRSLEALARAGAFDSLEPDRALVLASVDEIQAHAAREAEARASAQTSLFGGAEVVGLRRPTSFEPLNIQAKLDLEREAVGFYVSGHPLDDLVDAVRRRGGVDIGRIGRDLDVRGSVRIAGVVERRQERLSAKTQKRFAWLALSDPTGEIELLVPPEVLSTARETMEPGAHVLCDARAANGDGELRLIVDRIEPLETALRGAFGGVRLTVDTPAAVERVAKALEQLAAEPFGDVGQVQARIALSDRRLALVALPGRWPVGAAARAALRGIEGVRALEDA